VALPAAAAAADTARLAPDVTFVMSQMFTGPFLSFDPTNS